jgi:hypothetical protein
VSDEISEELGRCLVTEASQAGANVVGDEGVEVGVAFDMVAKAAMGAQLRSLLEMLAEAAVEALDHAVGLRVKRADQAVGNLVLGADAIEGMLAGRAAAAFCRVRRAEMLGRCKQRVDPHRYARCDAGTAGRRRRKVSRHRM